jgi:tetratricopeptide (TPR) repeat protein
MRLWSAVLILLVASSAQAQDAAAGDEEARQHFYEGAQLFGEGDFEGALSAFELSFELKRSPVILFNIAQALRSLDRYAEAIEKFEDYLEMGGSEISEEQRGRVSNTISSLRRRLAPITLDVSPPGARVIIDGHEVGTAPLREPLQLAAGRRVLQVEADGYESLREEIAVVGGVSRSIDVRLAQRDTAATLRLTSTPDDAAVRIDGLEVGPAPVVRRLSSGGHVVEADLTGYEHYRTAIDLDPDQQLDLNLALSEESGDGILTQWWFWTAVGVVAVAAAATIIVLSQREPEPIPGSSAPGVIEL